MLRALLRPAARRRAFSAQPALAQLPRISAGVLSDAAVAQFARDGAIVVRGAVPPEWVSELRKAAEVNLDDPGPLCDEHASAAGTGGRFHDDQFLFKRHAAFDEFVKRSGAGDVAARAMESKTAHIFYDQLFVKEPGTSAATPWHNDTSYWHIQGEQVCSIWVALDEVPRERGLSYVRGSHKWNLTHRITNFSGAAHSGKNTYEGAAELPPVPDVADIPAEDMLNWDMQPGDALLFYSAMLHGAPGVPGGSPHRRRGYATRWCGDDIRFVDKPGTMNAGWKAAGFHNGLEAGAPIACELHPNVVGGAL
ncbi:hypothetical protein M885DRAFT_460612 [Pelagophyceae sp. CCMP2097]|nr:hypothetical protein M885DRAFT_460612 [Pelagophyceae sp. CCMP2097]|mmetsp:Transcript_19466/g.66743  ORF Transcript_19466/g.66743 Transcript_19466/m.66743 type:complete len:308 (+) Transcript_19466:110-1033(+)